MLEQSKKYNEKRKKYPNLKLYCLAHTTRNSTPRLSPKSSLNQSFQINKSKPIIPQKKLSEQFNPLSVSINFAEFMKKSKAEDLRINKLVQETIKLFSTNMQFYKHNEAKLYNAINNQLKQKNYQCNKQILQLLHFHQLPTCQFALSHLQQQLKILNQFLIQLYMFRRKKQVTLIYENIKEEEQMIAKITNTVQYQNIYGTMHIKTTNFSNFDFISHYQSICNKFGSSEANTKPHFQIKNHLEKCVGKIQKIFQGSQKEKQNRKFTIRQTVRKK